MLSPIISIRALGPLIQQDKSEARQRTLSKNEPLENKWEQGLIYNLHQNLINFSYDLLFWYSKPVVMERLC